MVEDVSVETLSLWQKLDFLIAAVTFYLAFACMLAAVSTDSLLLAAFELSITAGSLPFGCLAWVRIRKAAELKAQLKQRR
ncbi:hypothetical protein [Salipiger sp. PrR003]|uniref:hypothetical protein n=1 Tax=Salipiger sp. PrR003 TaxID=2706776 RepID=UPI0013DBEA8D|nr:hypothetical protein [Salipiger sp. PrR003]NDV52599.1 hypothetical protein [Salipiger sp. PrR003]